MSRRIVLFFAAASAALIAGRAHADPECFGPSCRMSPQALMPQALMPQVEDPPRLTAEATAMDATGNLVDVTPPAIVEDRAQMSHAPAPLPAEIAAEPPARPAAVAAPLVPPLGLPPRPVPQMVADPATRAVPAPRYSADASPTTHTPSSPQARASRRPAARKTADTVKRSAPRETVRQTAQEEQEPAPLRVVTHGVAHGARVPDAVPAPGVVSVAPQVHVEGSVVVVSHPNAHDPAWRRCQTEGRGPRGCGPSSYHAYGAGGYRPLGSYRAYATAPGYIAVNPDPRIISIVRD